MERLSVFVTQTIQGVPMNEDLKHRGEGVKKGCVHFGFLVLNFSSVWNVTEMDGGKREREKKTMCAILRLFLQEDRFFSSLC